MNTSQKIVIAVGLTCCLASVRADDAPDCVGCHTGITPGIVNDWKLSKHSGSDVGCSECHGDAHSSADDVDKVKTVTADTCAECHQEQYDQFAKSKHALSWASMKAMPTTHYKPMELIDGMKGCGGCHKIGLKETSEINRLKQEGSGFGYASCDACHTRHTFSVKEAREPEACATCHMGFDHPQWEMWSTSKHGVRHQLKRDEVLPETAAAPTCQHCHMSKGDHNIHTAWGFLAVRTDGLNRYPNESDQWWADRVTILQALGVLDPEGKPTGRLDVVASAKVAKLSAAEFDAERTKMLAICSECHSENFAKGELAKGDRMIEQVDHLLAEAIRVIAGLYKDGVLKKPDSYASNFPDLLSFSDSPTPIENRLFLMHLKHRMRAFQGTFHANPDYALWYGWSEMQMDLTEIKAMAEDLRRLHAGK
ncbi:MAG: cytochrome c3 family protein [Phycisphaerales bacterium]|nr:cytochrome c3 family protein [Phycisphaerales bacterium]